MQRGKDFIRRTNEKKEIIEKRHKRQFIKLYIRIANDLINLIQKNNNINFERVFENYRPDYIFLFRNIFQDVKNAGFGFEIRKQLDFNTKYIVEIKKSLVVEKTEQEKINDRFDELYTLLLNNKTEDIVSDNFIQSEAKYFNNIYEKSITENEEFKRSLQSDLQEVNTGIFALALKEQLSKQERERKRILERKKEAVSKRLQDLQDNKNREAIRQFKGNLEDKIEVRAESNAEYGTGQATSEIKETEYNSLFAASVSTILLLREVVKKTWWENTQFFGGTPRFNHLLLSGTQANSSGNFNVSGYEVPTPRHSSLPIEETARCRCEVEYFVDI